MTDAEVEDGKNVYDVWDCKGFGIYHYDSLYRKYFISNTQ